MHQELERAFDDFANINRRLVDRSFARQFVADQHVARIEVKDAGALDIDRPHVGAQPVEQRIPARQQQLIAKFAFQQPQASGLDDF